MHFDGAGGNVAPGKYNDGTPLRRLEMATRIADAMERAWATMEKRPIAAEDVRWAVRAVRLPLREELTEEQALKKLADTSLKDDERIRAARDVVGSAVGARRVDRPGVPEPRPGAA